MTFAKPDSVTDEYGNVSTGWADQFTIAANITPRLGGETVEAARLAGRQVVIIRVRYTAETRTIAPEWKATDLRSDVVYNIRSATDPNLGDSRHGFWIDMLAESGVAV
jgi:head-tail adaptor